MLISNLYVTVPVNVTIIDLEDEGFLVFCLGGFFLLCGKHSIPLLRRVNGCFGL